MDTIELPGLPGGHSLLSIRERDGIESAHLVVAEVVPGVFITLDVDPNTGYAVDEPAYLIDTRALEDTGEVLRVASDQILSYSDRSIRVEDLGKALERLDTGRFPSYVDLARVKSSATPAIVAAFMRAALHTRYWRAQSTQALFRPLTDVFSAHRIELQFSDNIGRMVIIDGDAVASLIVFDHGGAWSHRLSTGSMRQIFSMPYGLPDELVLSDTSIFLWGHGLLVRNSRHYEILKALEENYGSLGNALSLSRHPFSPDDVRESIDAEIEKLNLDEVTLARLRALHGSPLEVLARAAAGPDGDLRAAAEELVELANLPDEELTPGGEAQLARLGLGGSATRIEILRSIGLKISLPFESQPEQAVAVLRQLVPNSQRAEDLKPFFNALRLWAHADITPQEQLRQIIGEDGWAPWRYLEPPEFGLYQASAYSWWQQLHSYRKVEGGIPIHIGADERGRRVIPLGFREVSLLRRREGREPWLQRAFALVVPYRDRGSIVHVLTWDGLHDPDNFEPAFLEVIQEDPTLLRVLRTQSGQRLVADHSDWGSFYIDDRRLAIPSSGVLDLNGAEELQMVRVFPNGRAFLKGNPHGEITYFLPPTTSPYRR